MNNNKLIICPVCAYGYVSEENCPSCKKIFEGKAWKVLSVLEDDYGCEEYDEDSPEMLIVIMENGEGIKKEARLTTDYIDGKGIASGSIITGK